MAKKTTTTALSSVRHDTLPLSALAPHPRNYRKHPQAQIARLAASLVRFGQVRSIVVQEGAPGRYLIVAGHGIAEAAKTAGITELHADVIPADWTPEQCEGYLLADNMAGADDDLVALAELLEAQQNAGFDLESVGSSADDLAALLENLTQAAAGDWEDALGDLPEGDKAPFQQMTFTLTDAQAEQVREALSQAKDDAPGQEDTGNANSNGNALAYIVASWLEGVTADE